ncbi:MAG: A24 family peptidase [bacterium]|nr:A24 family peptidase [bacterium]
MNPAHVVALVALALLLVASWIDLRSRTIPDSLSVGLLVLALLATTFGWHAVTFADLAIGAAVGFGLGAALFYLGAFGGGDAKLAAGLGACCGLWGLLEVLFGTALFGGVIALWARRRGLETLPYAPAFAAGFTAKLAVEWAVPPRTGLFDLLTGGGR